MSIMKSYKKITQVISKKKEGEKPLNSEEEKKRGIMKSVLLGLIGKKGKEDVKKVEEDKSDED